MQLELVEPTHIWVPPYSFTSGPYVGEVCAAAGFTPDPEQQLVLDAIFAENPDGTPAMREIEVIAPRQNIKTGLQLQTVIGWMFILDIEHALYTAHKWKTAERTFLTLQAIVNAAPFLEKRVRRFYEGNGEQKMMLKDDRLLEFSTRTGAGGRGPSPDKVILDEDFATQQIHMGSLVPSMATRPMAQLLRGSSAGHPGSQPLRDVRDRGRDGGDPFLAYFEWCMPDPAQACDQGDDCDHERGRSGCGLDKPELLAAANTQYGRRIRPDQVAFERATMTAGEFGRERGGWWDEPAGLEAVFDMADWAACEDPSSAIASTPHFAVEVSPNRLWSSIGVAGYRSDGAAHVEITSRKHVLDHRPGTDWLVPRLRWLKKRFPELVVVIAANAAAESLVPALEAAGVDVRRLVSSQVQAACGLIFDLVSTGRVRHGGQVELGEQVEAAKLRESEGGFSFARRKSGEITGLYAVTLALFDAHEAQQADYAIEDSIY